MTPTPAELALPVPAAASRAFDRAAAGFDCARALHDEARRRLLERLRYVRLEPGFVVDLGCATGAGAMALAERCPRARLVAADRSAAMLSRARAAVGASPMHDRMFLIRAHAERLPLRDHSIDLVVANLLLPWCSPPELLAEVARVLRTGGLFLFSTLGPDTLREVRRAWAEVDELVHVHAFLDMHDLGDLVVAAGLVEPVLDVDRIEVTYGDVRSMARDLRACGAVNTAAGRRRALTGRHRWQRFEQVLGARHRQGRIAVTVELVLGLAWGTGRTRPRRSDPVEVGVPVERIGRERPP